MTDNMENVMDTIFKIVFLLIFCLGVSHLAHCTTTGKTKGNSFGAVPYTENPYTYKVGSVTEGFDIEGEKGLVIRMQPYGTYALFTEDLLFCGFPYEKFVGKNPVVVTYETRAHRMINGVGCHNLLSVQELKQRTFNGDH